MNETRTFFHQLNQDYLRVHRTKEDLFWDTYMGISDDHAGFAQAEQAFKAFLSDPERLASVQQHLARIKTEPDSEEKRALQHGLEGWRALFECHSLGTEEARRCMNELIELEAELFAKRQQHTLFHLNEQGEREEASLGMLSTNLGSNPNEAARKSSHDALRELERWVLANGFLDLVAKRNELARALGFRNWFDYKVRLNERMSSEELFAILDDFEARTRDAHRKRLAELAAAKGEQALQPHNLRFHMSGDVTRRMDPYLPYAKSLERWVLSFRRLGIGFRGALVQLDLFERKGKYQNGFCHGPFPAHFDGQGAWRPAQINFTSEGKPDQVGSGERGINTLFHEGGHAAHFANVTQNAPCFSQEYPPTSMAYAETQSMFCDSLLGDADWLKRYAKTLAGQPIPDELIRARIEALQPFRAFEERMILMVPCFERALYELPDAERTPERLLALARATEQRILGVPSPRPLLSIPHQLNQESAAAFHGYLLAEMAVFQTRAYFLRTRGYLTDNPDIGPLLAQHYWAPGNGSSLDETLRSLTGEGFTGRYLADECNLSVEEAWRKAQAMMADAERRGLPGGEPPALDARVRIVHGTELIADNSRSETELFEGFERWIGERYPAATT